MRELIFVILVAIYGCVGVAYAAEPACQSQTIGLHTSKLCVSQAPFRHDYYTLWVDDDLIFTLPDDYIESVTLTHRIPEDAAIEFPLSMQGAPTVTISGGCVPISEQRELNGKKVGFEVGRSCSFAWGGVTVLRDLQVRF
ncbi:hypothetical protein [Burkholderia sp. F1]|uniref:hypothetical protein n=1 Tax=Burkholderia sp. F1 TaxID=3366817 RepID=UPI003D744F91